MRPREANPYLESRLREIRAHYDELAPRYRRYLALNSYYHRYLRRWVRSLIAPSQRVLDLGCGLGDYLHDLAPSRGLGIDLSPKMIEQARQDHPELEFRAEAIEAFAPQEKFDAVLLMNVLDYGYDLGAILAKAGASLVDDGRVLVNAANPLWSAIFRLTSRLGLRIPDCNRLFIDDGHLRNLLLLQGFEITYEAWAMVLPKNIPLLSPLLNWIVPKIPVLRSLCSTRMLMGRKIPGRRELSVSIVIPCYNERKNIESCLRNVPKLGARTEVIFVDDGSQDGTAQAVDPSVREDVEIKLVSYRPNRGKGNAVKTGFLHSTGDVVMILDADLTTPTEDLDAVYEALATGRAEFVNCTRMMYPMENKAMKVANFIGNKMFTLLVSWLIGRPVTDTLCGTKAFFRRHFPYIEMGRDPWGDFDLLFGAAQLRLSLREIPVHYRERIAEKSKMKAFSHAMKLLRICGRGFLQIHFRRPLRLENRLSGET